MRKSWADSMGIRSGVMGEIVDGVTISEENRATVYETRKEGIEMLRKIWWENYAAKGVQAVLFGIWYGENQVKYAIFVEDNFLREVDEEC